MSISSTIHLTRIVNKPSLDHAEMRRQRIKSVERLRGLLAQDDCIANRYEKITDMSKRIRASEYHVTSACNIRCKGCWFFEYGHDKEVNDEKSDSNWRGFIEKETTNRRINCALIIGGEPSMFIDRLRLFREKFKYVTVSTNGYKRIPMGELSDVAIGITLFGGGVLDDDLRAIKPSGRRFTGLFDIALENYKNDPRAGFVYALTEDGISHIEETVKRIHENRNSVTFNFYSKYGVDDVSSRSTANELLAEAMRVKLLYPDTVLSTPYYINTIITGRSHWGSFGYDECPSISVDHVAHVRRKQNGNPYLPLFNAWSSDLNTIKFCCTSGHCNGCRDSQAVFSWLLVNAHQFTNSLDDFKLWLDTSESYWRQFIWSQFNKNYSNVCRLENSGHM